VLGERLVKKLEIVDEGEDARCWLPACCWGEIKSGTKCLLLSAGRAGHVINKVWATVPRAARLRSMHVTRLGANFAAIGPTIEQIFPSKKIQNSHNA
jgi:hypothetical protein